MGAGKVFLNHTRWRRKEKAPKLGAFFSTFFLGAGIAPALE
jgi:hypothetical protein